MEIIDHTAVLTLRDQVASGLPREVPAVEIDMCKIFGAHALDVLALRECQAANDGELIRTEREALLPDADRLRQHRETLIKMGGKLIAHKAEIFLSEF